MTTHLILPFDHILIHIRAMEISRREGCELCYSKAAHKLKNGARLCDECREMLREMQERAE